MIEWPWLNAGAEAVSALAHSTCRIESPREDRLPDSARSRARAQGPLFGVERTRATAAVGWMGGWSGWYGHTRRGGRARVARDTGQGTRARAAGAGTHPDLPAQALVLESNRGAKSRAWVLEFSCEVHLRGIGHNTEQHEAAPRRRHADRTRPAIAAYIPKLAGLPRVHFPGALHIPPAHPTANCERMGDQSHVSYVACQHASRQARGAKCRLRPIVPMQPARAREAGRAGPGIAPVWRARAPTFLPSPPNHARASSTFVAKDARRAVGGDPALGPCLWSSAPHV